MNCYINDRNLEKIKQRNFKGMHLADVRTQLAIELMDTEESLRLAKEQRKKELDKQVNVSNKDLLAIHELDERVL